MRRFSTCDGKNGLFEFLDALQAERPLRSFVATSRPHGSSPQMTRHLLHPAADVHSPALAVPIVFAECLTASYSSALIEAAKKSMRKKLPRSRRSRVRQHRPTIASMCKRCEPGWLHSRRRQCPRLRRDPFYSDRVAAECELIRVSSYDGGGCGPFSLAGRLALAAAKNVGVTAEVVNVFEAIVA